MSGPVRLLYAVTAPVSALIFLRGQLSYMAAQGYEVHLVCADTPDGEVAAMCANELTTFHPLHISRRPSPRSDLSAFVDIHHVIREVRPSVLIAGTPKMSLLALTAALLARVPDRVYLCHGLRHEGYSGGHRAALRGFEWAMCAVATDVVAVSASVADGLTPPPWRRRHLAVLGAGSPNGVDIDRFRVPSPPDKTRARQTYSLNETDCVVTFVGRLTRDKGLDTLVHLAERLAQLDDVRLLLVGPTEGVDAADRAAIESLTSNPLVTYRAHERSMQHVYWATDVLVLPTRREGLPTVVLEAGACAVPTVAYSATGTVDAIVHDRTGVLVMQGDKVAFGRAVEQLLTDRPRRAALGAAAHAHVVGHFASSTVWTAWATFVHGIRKRRRARSLHRAAE